VPLHSTSSGKLFLSLLPARQRKRLLHSAPLKRYTSNTITKPELMKKELTQIRAQRIGIDNEENLVGLIAIAVPVIGRRGRICGAVSINAPTSRMTLEQARAHVPALRRAAGAISSALLVN
jgi:DNA-binding IclR family transcriptional regulator